MRMWRTGHQCSMNPGQARDGAHRCPQPLRRRELRQRPCEGRKGRPGGPVQTPNSSAGSSTTQDKLGASDGGMGVEGGGGENLKSGGTRTHDRDGGTKSSCSDAPLAPPPTFVTCSNTREVERVRRGRYGRRAASASLTRSTQALFPKSAPKKSPGGSDAWPKMLRRQETQAVMGGEHHMHCAASDPLEGMKMGEYGATEGPNTLCQCLWQRRRGGAAAKAVGVRVTCGGLPVGAARVSTLRARTKG